MLLTYSMLGALTVSGMVLATSKLQSFIMSQANSEVHVVPVIHFNLIINLTPF